ncbi:MAG TPA: hypothetical protein VFM18_08135 [Methanosarcina sp.]|nr:hypothetical protein [Methanosarcina sp.]
MKIAAKTLNLKICSAVIPALSAVANFTALKLEILSTRFLIALLSLFQNLFINSIVNINIKKIFHQLQCQILVMSMTGGYKLAICTNKSTMNMKKLCMKEA